MCFRFLFVCAPGFPVAPHSYFHFFRVLDFRCICWRQIFFVRTTLSMWESENSCSRRQMRLAGSWVGARGFPADPTPQTACSVIGPAPRVFVRITPNRAPALDTAARFSEKLLLSDPFVANDPSSIGSRSWASQSVAEAGHVSPAAQPSSTSKPSRSASAACSAELGHVKGQISLRCPHGRSRTCREGTQWAPSPYTSCSVKAATAGGHPKTTHSHSAR